MYVIAFLIVLLAAGCVTTPAQEVYRRARLERADACLKPFPHLTYGSDDRFGTIWIARRDGQPNDLADLNTIRACMDYAGHLKSAP